MKNDVYFLLHLPIIGMIKTATVFSQILKMSVNSIRRHARSPSVRRTNQSSRNSLAFGWLAVLWEGGIFDEANSISGAILNEFKRKDWGEEKIWSGEGEGREEKVFLLPSRTTSFQFFSSPQSFLLNSFNIAPEIDFASSNFPPAHKTPATQASVWLACFLFKVQ